MVTASDTNLSASPGHFSLLLVASLGGLLLKRLLERLEAHMEDAHCSESAVKTQATRKISVLGHRMCCKMRPLVKCNSPWFLFPLMLLLGLSVSHMVSCTQALLPFLSLSCKGSHHSLFFLLPCLTLRGRTSCTWREFLAGWPGLQGFLQPSWLLTLPAHPPTLAVVFLYTSFLGKAGL